VDLGKQDAPVAGNTEAGLKGPNQGHVQFAQNNLVDFHIYGFLRGLGLLG
jgi:hypothetical protein